MSRIVALFCVLFAGYVSGNLIRNSDDITNVPVPNVEIESNASEITTKDVSITKDDVDNNEVDTPVEVLGIGTDPPKKCAAIGQFCTFHSECCTNACLGYLKKCVSGSG